MSLNMGDLIEFLPGSWNSEYRVVQGGIVDKRLNANTPYMAVRKADFMCSVETEDVLVQAEMKKGAKLKTIARRHGVSWIWKKFKFGANYDGSMLAIQAALPNGTSMNFHTDTVDTAKMIIESVCRMFDLRGRCKIYTGDNVYIYQFFKWDGPVDREESNGAIAEVGDVNG